MSIHQEVVFSATPEQIYNALMNAEKHADFTGGPAKISQDEGGACSWHDGKIIGRNIELKPNMRIVQAWRAGNWEGGVYSIIKYELKAQGKETRIIFDHTGYPENQKENLADGWNKRYWEPLKKYLSA